MDMSMQASESRAVHAQPAEGMECMCCMESITEENYVEYQYAEGGAWNASLFCQACLEQLVQSQFHQYVHRLTTSTCKAEQRRLLARGPPINVSDKTALPTPAGEEACALWYASDGQVHSAKLDGSLEGEARRILWEEHRAFLIADEPDHDGEETA